MDDFARFSEALRRGRSAGCKGQEVLAELQAAGAMDVTLQDVRRMMAELDLLDRQLRAGIVGRVTRPDNHSGTC